MGLSDSSNVIVPADFEQNEAVLIAYEREPLEGHQDKLLAAQRDVLIEIIAACHTAVDITVLVSDEESQNTLNQAITEKRIDKTDVRIVGLDFNSLWIRDYGAIQVRDGKGKLSWLDFDYYLPGDHWVNDEGQRYNRTDDDQAFVKLANELGQQVKSVKLVLHGGALLSNGDGLILISEAVFDWNYKRFGYSEQETAERFKECFPGNQLVFVSPLVGEPTHHLDMFMLFTDSRTLVLGTYSARYDEVNRVKLNRLAKNLSELSVGQEKLHIERIPMPPHGKKIWGGSYTNVLFANKKLLLPIYGVDPSLVVKAKKVYQHLLPTWEIVEIPSTALVIRHGAIHCVTYNLASNHNYK